MLFKINIEYEKIFTKNLRLCDPDIFFSDPSTISILFIMNIGYERIFCGKSSFVRHRGIFSFPLIISRNPDSSGLFDAERKENELRKTGPPK